MPPSLIPAWLRPPAVRRALGLGLVALSIAAALLVTQYPFHLRLGTASLSRIDWRLYYLDSGHSVRDLVQNLLMLVPLGVGLALARHGLASLARIALEACALGFGTSVLLEALQIFQRGRFPQAADVWRNGAGCVVGAVLVALVLRAIDRRRSVADAS